MGTVEVTLNGNIIEAVYTGTMTIDLVRDGEQRIEAFIKRVPHPAVLYDTLAMVPPPIALAMEMKSFDSRVKERVIRSATVVRDSATAFMAKVAFVFSRDHMVFYQDRDAALRWLQTGVMAAQIARVTEGG